MLKDESIPSRCQEVGAEDHDLCVNDQRFRICSRTDLPTQLYKFPPPRSATIVGRAVATMVY